MEEEYNDNNSNTYSVPFANFETLCRKLEKVASRIDRQGGTLTMDIVDKEVRVDYVGWPDRNGKLTKIRIPCYLIKVEGVARLNGWTFAATIEHDEGSNIIRTSPKFEDDIPTHYQTVASICEHCNSQRDRKITHVIRHDDGTWKQVGTSCLREYMGIDAEDITRAMQIIREGVYNTPRKTDLEIITDIALRFAAETVRKFGYVKSGQPNSTKEMVWKFLNIGTLTKSERERVTELMSKHDFDPTHDEVLKMVDEAMDWLNTTEDDSNYINNLKVIANRENVNPKHMGYLVSIFSSHEFAKNKAEKDRIRREEIRQRIEAEKDATDYVGNVGDRLQITVTEVKALASWDTDFGTMTVYKVKDDIGNIFIWKTTNYLPTDITTLKGTVKEHNERDGMKQTILTRCKVVA